MALVERNLIELNQQRPDPSLNALMTMTTFSVGNLIAAYSGNYNAFRYSIEATKICIEKFDRYYAAGYGSLNVSDASYVQSIKQSIAPYVNTNYIPNILYVMPLGPDLRLEATVGMMSFVSYDDLGNRKFETKYDYTNIHKLGKDIKDRLSRIRTQKPQYEPIPIYLSALDDDERDVYDRIVNTTKVLLQEFGEDGDGKISIDDLVLGDIILNPSIVSIPDLVPIGFDFAGQPIYSKISFISRSSFDPDKYNIIVNGSIFSSADPYDNIVGVDTNPSYGIGGGTSSGVNTSTQLSTDAWYDSYDEPASPDSNPVPTPVVTTPGTSSGGGSSSESNPSDGHTYGGEGE